MGRHETTIDRAEGLDGAASKALEGSNGTVEGNNSPAISGGIGAGILGAIPSVAYERVSYTGGATRSPVNERYDLIPFSGLQAVARRFAYGAVRHGDRNWENGGVDFAEATLNHLLKHAGKFSQHRKQDDLDAVICNAMMLAEFKTKGFLPEK